MTHVLITHSLGMDGKRGELESAQIDLQLFCLPIRQLPKAQK